MDSQLAKTVQSVKAVTRGYYVGNEVQCDFCWEWIDRNKYDEHLERKCKYHWVKCEWCNRGVIAADLDSHQSGECDYRTVYCYNCFEPYIYCQGHLCKCCAYCGRTLGYGEYCDCPECEIYGQEPWWMKEGYPAGGSGGVSDNGGGTGSTGNPNAKTETKQLPHKPYQELKKSSSIKWLGNKSATTASENLKKMGKMHPQMYGTHDCVPRAFAFLEELWYGVDFDTALQKNRKRAKNAGIDTRERGFSWGEITEKLQLQKVFLNDPTVVRYTNDLQTIRECIDEGIPVAVVAQGRGHMVVVIGYDLDNSDGNKLYVAAGNPECDVSIIGSMYRNTDYEYVFGIRP
jgi:hypothetical protein